MVFLCALKTQTVTSPFETSTTVIFWFGFYSLFAKKVNFIKYQSIPFDHLPQRKNNSALLHGVKLCIDSIFTSSSNLFNINKFIIKIYAFFLCKGYTYVTKVVQLKECSKRTPW